MKAVSQLDQLKNFTTVVADTGDFNQMREFSPQEATTNPSLILQAASLPDYQELITEAIRDAKSSGLGGQGLLLACLDRLLVRFGQQILTIVPGRVSTEVDARLSFNTEGTIAKAKQLINLYENMGIDRERILIKIAATWEGIQAASVLEKECIHCNLTLLFSLVQAVACAKAKVRLISPFVGRILDWYKATTKQDYTSENDPGVLSVKEIYTYFKYFDYNTQIMGASFRNTGEILELAGCDLLTISPSLLSELARNDSPISRKLTPESAKQEKLNPIPVDEQSFRWLLNENAMATEKTAEGIRKFAQDTHKLEELLLKKI